MIKKEDLDPSKLTVEDIKAFKARYEDNPFLFVKEILGLMPDSNQIKILQSVLDNDYTSVASGRGIGKSWALSMVAIWTICTRPSAKVLMMSNTDNQSKSTLWAPLCEILRNSLVADWFDITTELIHFKGDRDTAFIKRLVWSEHNIESVSGYHSENMIYLCDEASKYPNAVLDNLYASCTQSWNKMLLTTNPTRNTGYFFDTATNQNWNFLEIDSRDSVHTDKNKIQELMDTYGENSDTVRVQVLGKFPRFTSESILNQSEIDRACSTHPIKTQENHIVSMGIDIGGGSDATVFAIRKGYFLLDIIKLTSRNDEPILRKAVELCNKHNVDIVSFDESGLGHFLHTKFSNILPRKTEIYGRNFGEGSPDPDCFNMRAWLYRRFRDWIQTGGVVGNNPEIKRQIQATETYMDDKGRLRLIDKKLIKKELGNSPDELDALVLSCGYNGDLINTRFVERHNYTNINAMLRDAGKWS
jgi:hypothetical protein